MKIKQAGKQVKKADMTAFTGRKVDTTLYQRRRKKNLINHSKKLQ